MAFPQVQGSVPTDGGNTNFSTLNINLPPDIEAGQLLLVWLGISYGSNSVITWPAGWEPLTRVSRFAGSGGRSGQWAYRKAAGTEGASIQATTSESQQFTAQAYRISGALDPAIQPPEVSPGADGSGSNPNPDNLTATGGAKDYLWLASTTGGTDVSSPPANYTNLIAAASAGNVGRATWTARRELNAESENPGAFTGSNSTGWVAQTLVVHPADAAAPEMQRLRAVATDANPGNYTGDPDNIDLHNNINQVEPDDASFVRSPETPSNAVIRFKLADGAIPLTNENHETAIRLRKSPDSGGQQISVEVRLLEWDGGEFNVHDAWTIESVQDAETYIREHATAVIDEIVDRTQLYIEISSAVTF